MSQVQKFLNGSVIKAQAGETIPESKENKKKYGRVIIDGKEEANGSEEDYLKFRDYLRSAPNQYGATTAAVLDQLARGEDYITSTENKHNVNMGNAHSGFARFFQALAPVETKGEAERNAINYIRKYSKAPSVEKSIDKNKFTNSRRDFEWYGTDAKGKYQSGNATNAYIDRQINTYLDWLANPDEWGKTNEFTASHYDEPALRAWWDQYKTAPEGDTTSQRDRAYAAVKSYLDMIAGGTRGDWEKGKDKWEDARELLRLFNIYPDSSGAGNGAGSGSGSGDGAGVKKQGALYTTRKGDASKGEYENAVYTDFRGVNGDKRMYLLNEDRLPYFTGLDSSYLNGIIDPVTGRVYKYSELDASDHLLGNKMRPIDFKNAVIVANNSARNIDDVYNTENGVAKYLNFTDYANNYGKYNSNENMIGNRAVQEYLNDEYHTITDAALFNPTNSYSTEAEGDRIYGIYDFTKGRYGTSEFGFRAPYYIVVDKNGNLRLQGNNLTYPSVVGANWDDVSDLYNVVNRYGQRYAVIGTVTDTFNEEHQIFMDANGQQYVDYGGEMHPLSDETIQKIKNKKPITRQDLTGDTSKSGYQPGGGYARVHKEGGSIPKIRPLPVSRYQTGSKFMVTKTTPKDVELKDSPLNHGAPLNTGQNLAFKDWWAGLNDDDKRDVYAAGLDVLSAVTALVPSPYTAAGALGLGMTSSGLMAASDLHRGKSGWGVAGQTLLNVGLDAASAVPWLGESAAMVKIAKHVGRVGKWVGPIFTALGLSQAAGAISKSMRGETLNTEDLLALSAGFQSILNIGHVKLKNAGDASLASLRKGIDVGDANAIHKTKTFGTGESAREIKLTKEQAHEIAGTGSEAAQNLRATLKEAGMTDEELGAITDTKLLKDWGFDFSLSKHGANAGKIKSVSVHGEPSLTARAKSKLNGEDNNFSKYGYLTDFGRGQRRRQAYIDKAMKDESAREALGKAVDEMDEGVLGLRKLLTRRAYGRAEQRNNIEGQYSSGLWKMYERPVAGTNTTPEVSATSTTAPTASSNNPTPAPRSITLSREIVPIPRTETAPVTERGFTLGAGTFVNSPSRPGRAQLPGSQNDNLLPVPARSRTPREKKFNLPSLQSLLTREMPTKIKERVERATASKSLANQKRQYQNTAKVIEELRKPGADPMKILSNAHSQSKLAESEYDELVNALEQAINNANKKSRIIDGRQLNRDEYRDLVENLFLSMFKSGGKINPKIDAFTSKFKNGGKVVRMWRGGPFDYSDVDDYLTKHNGAVNPQLLDLLKKYNIDPKDFLNWARENDYKFWDAVDENEMLDDIEEYSKARSLPFDRANSPSKSNLPEVTVPGVKLNDFDFTVPYDDSEITSFANDSFYNDVYNPLVKSLSPSGNSQTTATSSSASNAPSLIDVLRDTFGTYNTGDLFKGTDRWWEKPVAITEDAGVETLPTPKKPNFHGGWNMDLTGLKAQLAKDIPEGAKFIGSLLYNKANFNAAKRGIRDFVNWNQYAPTQYVSMSTATPIQDAQLNYWQDELGRNPYNFTSNGLDMGLLKLQHDANVMPNINQAFRDKSAATMQISQQNNAIKNKQLEEYSNTARHNRSVLGQGALSESQAEQSRIQNDAQSFANLLTKKGQDITTELNKALDSRLAFDANALQNNYNTDWLNKVSKNYSSIWKEWTSEPDQYKYNNDFNTWAQNTGRWNNALSTDWDKHQKALGLAMGQLSRKFLSPSAQAITRPISSTIYSKSGGKIRNRYKNEPWEDIWINQNKATLKGTSKLNDNVIKILLKALK